MEIEWEDPPVPDGPFFTRAVYDEVGFGPSIQELFNFLQSSQKNSQPGESSAQTEILPVEENVQKSSISKDSCDSEGSSVESEAEAETKTSSNKKVTIPDPRVPYPCKSALSKTEQRKYVNFIFNKKERVHPPEVLLNKVNNEVMQFMVYLQDVSRRCAEDYNIIPKGALQYSEEVFRSCLDYMKTLPEAYQLLELTSLTGGRFKTALALKFEKELLHMGTVVMTDFRPAHVGTVLASDYQTVSSHSPPAKKAKELHTFISHDNNAERLCSVYEPHVCLTKEALIQLINNQGPDFRDEWEIPVLIKSYDSKDKSQKKAVYIDSPLLKREVTVRERSHIFHEESLKLFASTGETGNVLDLMARLHSCKQSEAERTIATVTNDCIDFDVDFQDLETFGESASIKASIVKKTKRVSSEKGISQTKSSLKSEGSSLDEEMESRKQPLKDKGSQNAATPQRKNRKQENTACHPLNEDSDDDALVIADPSPKHSAEHKQSETPSSKISPSPKTGKQKRKAPLYGDQLSEILQMQTAMFTSNPKDAPPKAPQEACSPSRQGGPAHPNAAPLVKACVSSYLERSSRQGEETGDAQNAAAPESAKFERLLSPALQAATEDERDYERPEEGNVSYKLLSLDKLLLMVRSSISSCHVGKRGNPSVPVNILTKLEYQLTYGVECLTSGEACQLWTEMLLHPRSESFIAHVDALTSRVALVRKLPDDWVYNISCGFKPTKSLNILHHLLQKFTGLDEGQYLIRHMAGEPFVNILRAAHGNGRQGVYNLRQIHSDIPPPPTSAVPPWIPVDPSVCLPFHRKHARVPCTFPPEELAPPQKSWAPQTCQHRRGQPGQKKQKKKSKKKNFTQKKKS